ncbi:MAG: acyl-CoA synthetase [Micromonosporaceae bacterium]
MADVSSRERATDALRSAGVLRRAGLFRPARPDESLRSLLSIRRYGPFAGAMRIAAQREPDSLGLVDDLGTLTFTQLDRRSNALARAWQGHGITAGDVVGLLCRNHRGFLDTLFACGKIGARTVLLNTGFSARQLADVAAREGVSVMVYDQEFAPIVAAMPALVGRYLAWVDVPMSADVPSVESLIVTTDDDDVAPPRTAAGMVLLTSGTTGTPKGAPREVRSPLGAAEFLDRVPYRRREATMIGAPLFHGTGMSQLIVTLALASTTVLARRFDPGITLGRIHQLRCTAAVLVPTMLQRILDMGPAVLSRYDTASLRIILCAGSAISPDLGNRTMRAFGPVLYNLYGSTEVAVATVATPQDWRRAPGTVGKPPVGCRVRLYDDHDKPVKRPYQRGRIFVGSGLQFSGYTGGGSKEEIDGLLSTGDVGHLDANGLLFIDGRADDMIISGGENVYPGEVENLLVEHPAVREAAVVGVPDPAYGQRLKAYLVLEPGAWLDPAQVQQYVRANLARFKVPRDIAYLTDLPRNPTGKLLRHLLP